MSLLEDVFSFGINLLRGELGSFGELKFQVYATRLNSTLQALGQAGSQLINDETTRELLARASGTKVLTFRDYQRRSRARYAKHELINRTTALEKVGDEVEQITLTIKLVKALGVSPEEQARLIRDYIREGHQDFLVIGAEVIGQFVITSMEESREYVDCFGRTQVSELRLTFEEFADAI